MSNVVNNGTNVKEVVVYDADIIRGLLERLNSSSVVTGVDNMRVIVEIFDILNTRGNVQQVNYVPNVPVEEKPVENVTNNETVVESDDLPEGN